MNNPHGAGIMWADGSNVRIQKGFMSWDAFDRALDCSGLTQYCYAQAGISIGHNTEAQASQLRHVPLSQAKPGDILYRPGHVAIYAGGDQYIHEPHSGDVCRRASGISYFSYALTYRAI
ncbi:MAG: C40 family peptidase [Adlercreutzia equolifaciens]|nr:C40 family peptidase [Adlercreutzia equolifaciens]